MLKPQGYDNAQAFTEFETLEKGGHICIIKKIEETTSKAGKPMLKIYLDTDKSDRQPNFFTEKWKNDSRENKTWGCIHYLVTDGSEWSNKSFKTFNEAVQASNGNFPIDWNNYTEQFKGKLVCGVFRIEQYISDSDGEIKSPVKLYSFRTLQDFKNGKVKEPKDKLIDNSASSSSTLEPPKFNDDIMPVDDGDIPF